MNNYTKYTSLLLVILGAVLFVPLLGKAHLFDWDEINFAEIAREMIVTSDYLTVQIDYLPFWEKPPLFFWLQVVTMKIFGINEFAARLPNALAGIFTMQVLYSAGSYLYNRKFGLLWILTYIGSVLPFFYFKSGIIDPWFNLFIFSSLYLFIRFLHTDSGKHRMRFITLSGISIGLAILTKGPVGLLLLILTGGVYLLAKRRLPAIRTQELAAFIGMMLIFGGIWFIIQALTGNFDIIKDFILYQIRLFRTEGAGHKGFLLYHFVVLLFGVFPASIFALKGFRKRGDDNAVQRDFRFWMIMLLAVVLVVFTIVSTKIIHYSSLAYFPLTFLAAQVAHRMIQWKIRLSRWQSYALIFIGSIYALAMMILPFVDIIKPWLLANDIIKDPFVNGNLQADGQWTGFEAITGFLLLSGVVTGTVLLRRNKIAKGLITVFGSVMISTYLITLVFIPNIERYTQHAAIAFYKQHRQEDCYFETLGFKSYADLYYTRKTPPDNPKAYNKTWLLRGNIDKKAYFVTKIQKKERFLSKYKELEVMYEKNGFVFLRRDPPGKNHPNGNS